MKVFHLFYTITFYANEPGKGLFLQTYFVQMPSSVLHSVLLQHGFGEVSQKATTLYPPLPTNQLHRHGSYQH